EGREALSGVRRGLTGRRRSRKEGRHGGAAGDEGVLSAHDRPHDERHSQELRLLPGDQGRAVRRVQGDRADPRLPQAGVTVAPRTGAALAVLMAVRIKGRAAPPVLAAAAGATEDDVRSALCDGRARGLLRPAPGSPTGDEAVALTDDGLAALREL